MNIVNFKESLKKGASELLSWLDDIPSLQSQIASKLTTSTPLDFANIIKTPIDLKNPTTIKTSGNMMIIYPYATGTSLLETGMIPENRLEYRIKTLEPHINTILALAILTKMSTNKNNFLHNLPWIPRLTGFGIYPIVTSLYFGLQQSNASYYVVVANYAHPDIDKYGTLSSYFDGSESSKPTMFVPDKREIPDDMWFGKHGVYVDKLLKDLLLQIAACMAALSETCNFNHNNLNSNSIMYCVDQTEFEYDLKMNPWSKETPFHFKIKSGYRFMLWGFETCALFYYGANGVKIHMSHEPPEVRMIPRISVVESPIEFIKGDVGNWTKSHTERSRIEHTDKAYDMWYLICYLMQQPCESTFRVKAIEECVDTEVTIAGALTGRVGEMYLPGPGQSWLYYEGSPLGIYGSNREKMYKYYSVPRWTPLSYPCDLLSRLISSDDIKEKSITLLNPSTKEWTASDTDKKRRSLRVGKFTDVGENMSRIYDYIMNGLYSDPSFGDKATAIPLAKHLRDVLKTRSNYSLPFGTESKFPTIPGEYEEPESEFPTIPGEYEIARGAQGAIFRIHYSDQELTDDDINNAKEITKHSNGFIARIVRNATSDEVKDTLDTIHNLNTWVKGKQQDDSFFTMQKEQLQSLLNIAKRDINIASHDYIKTLEGLVEPSTSTTEELKKQTSVIVNEYKEFRNATKKYNETNNPGKEIVYAALKLQLHPPGCLTSKTSTQHKSDIADVSKQRSQRALHVAESGIVDRDLTILRRFPDGTIEVQSSTIVNEVLASIMCSKLYTDGKCPNFVEVKDVYCTNDGRWFILMERIDGTLNDLTSKLIPTLQQRWRKRNEELRAKGKPIIDIPTRSQIQRNVLLQVIYALHVYHTTYRGMHTDLHSGNIFLKLCDESLFNKKPLSSIESFKCRLDNDTEFDIPNVGIIAKIGDLGFASFEIKRDINTALQTAWNTTGKGNRMVFYSRYDYSDWELRKERLLDKFMKRLGHDNSLSKILEQYSTSKQMRRGRRFNSSFDLYCLMSGLGSVSDWVRNDVVKMHEKLEYDKCSSSKEKIEDCFSPHILNRRIFMYIHWNKPTSFIPTSYSGHVNPIDMLTVPGIFDVYKKPSPVGCYMTTTIAPRPRCICCGRSKVVYKCSRCHAYYCGMACLLMDAELHNIICQNNADMVRIKY